MMRFRTLAGVIKASLAVVVVRTPTCKPLSNSRPTSRGWRSRRRARRLAVLDLALEQGEDLVLTFQDLDRLRGQHVDGVQCFVVGFCASIACGCLDVLADHDGDHRQGLKYATDDQQHEGVRVGVKAEWAHLRKQYPAPD